MLSPKPAARHEAPLRRVRMAECRAVLERRPGGELIIRNPEPLGPYAESLTDRLDHWAQHAPERVWLAARDRAGDWEQFTYAAARARVRRLATALLARGLSPERPLVILSGNGMSHALLATAALYAGIPYAAVSPAYSLLSSDFAKLRSIFDLLTPGLVFIADAAPFARAIAEVVPREVEIVVEDNPPAGRLATALADLGTAEDAAALAAARAGITGESVAKFLFTSGSTGMPKAVINTQRMLCANCEQMTAHFAYLRDEPPVTLDWAPWNHTAGGNHNFNLILYNGGTLYIDEGKPTPAAIGATVRNLRDVSPNWYFNVPKGYDALLPFLREDADLRRSFFRDLKLLWYAGAGMAQHIWDGLDELSVATTGERVTVLTGLGSTETAPFAIGANQSMLGAGLVGLPAQGCELKLVPVDGKLEARIRGPNITPGYWRQPDLTRNAFDEEGFYKFGDALRFADPADVNKGFYFDGRIAEDFKLSTGTWVAVGPLRAALIDHFAPFVQDVVIAGLDQEYVAALIFPDIHACRTLMGDPHAGLPEIAAHEGVRQHFRTLLTGFARGSTGSSNRVARAMLLAEGPSIDSGELTDKGSLNQRAVLRSRPAALAALYAADPGEAVLVAG